MDRPGAVEWLQARTEATEPVMHAVESAAVPGPASLQAPAPIPREAVVDVAMFVGTIRSVTASPWFWAVLIAALVGLLGVGAGVVWSRRSRADGHGARPTDHPDPDAEASRDPAGRIEALLETRGGRMRQSEIVEATGWSKSKVSVLLSEMEAADRVRKLRVGRENIVSLPGREPEATRSPDDG